MLSSALRTSRLGIAAALAIVATFLAAAPALAATVSVDGSAKLFYDADVGELNDLTITGTGAALTVSDPGTASITPGAGCTADQPQTVTCVGVSTIEVRVSNMNDTVTLSTDLVSDIHGQLGDDRLNGGPGLDILRGGPGTDFLSGGDGPDTLIGEDGDDQLIGGSGVDTANFVAGTGATVDLNNTTSPQDTGAGMDTLTAIEKIIGSRTGGDVLTGDASPNTFTGGGGDDLFIVTDGGSDVVVCGTGTDEVFLDRTDVPRFRFDPAEGSTCETVDDGLAPATTTITAGPSGLTNDPTWTFESDEPWVAFECAFVESGADPDVTGAWFPCRPGQRTAPPADGSWVFGVRAVDDQANLGPSDSRDFTFDSTPPDTRIDSGPSGGGITSDPTPEFSFSSADPDTVSFLCRFDAGPFFVCSSPLTADPLSDGEHNLQVAASDAVGNFDQTPAAVTFRVETGGAGPGPGDGPAPNPQAPSQPQAQQAKIIIGSLVLISGSTVKMSRKGRIRISLTCAGARKCTGRLSITTAKPVSRRSRKLTTLGTKRFSIAANKKRKISVRFSKRRMRLAKRLKRFKAKAVIREIDERGNPRISSRIFILRAR